MKKHFFVRHAHRPLDDWSHGVNITEEGERAAYALGVNLKEENIKLVSSSPIKRCKQTASGLLQGMERKIPIIEHDVIGIPGAIIADQELANQALQKHELHKVVDLLLEGVKLDGFSNIDAACGEILQHLLDHPESSLSVSHDFYIALLAGWIFQKRCDAKFIPYFLEALILHVDDKGVTAEYKGLKTSLK